MGKLSQPMHASSPPISRLASVASDRAPLRVAHVLLGLEAAGAEIVCARLASRLAPSRFSASVIALEGRGPLASWLEERRIPVECLDVPEGLRPDLVLRLAAALHRRRAQIVHCHNCKAMLYGGLAALLVPGARVVMTKHGARHWTTGGVARLGRFLMRRAEAVTVVSDDIAGRLTAGGWVRPDRLFNVGNGVDTDEFRPAEDRDELRARLGFGPEHRLIGMVQRLSPEKDPLALAQAFETVARESPEARLIVVGDGPLRAEMEALVAASDARDRVLFLGVRRDVPELLGTLDLFCLPSRTEGTSLSLLEAMACGLPVVATAVGGTPGVVAEGRSGLLVPPERPELLSRALLELLRDPDRRRDMGTEGRRIVCTRYSLEASVSRYAKLYERVAMLKS